jgi:hypothetical protein
MEYKFIELHDEKLNINRAPIKPIVFEQTEWDVLYVALLFDGVLKCYKYLGSVIADKGIHSLVVLLSRQHPNATHYAELSLRPVDKLKEIKDFYDKKLLNEPLVCFSEITASK